MRYDALGRRHVLGQRVGGEGHTSYDSLPKGASEGCMQNYAEWCPRLARRGDLLRRAADLNAYSSCRPPLLENP